MEFQTIEEMSDVVSLSVAEVSASDVEEAGEQVQPVAITKKSSNSWDEDYETRVIVEEILTINSRDSIATQATKHCINEILSRRNCSRPIVALYRNSGGQTAHDCAPTNVDFTADVCLAAKRSLSRRFYEVFCYSLDCGFENWDRVPAAVRKHITEKTGAELLRRGIFNVMRGTRGYWSNDFRKNGRPSAPATFRLT